LLAPSHDIHVCTQKHTHTHTHTNTHTDTHIHTHTDIEEYMSTYLYIYEQLNKLERHKYQNPKIIVKVNNPECCTRSLVAQNPHHTRQRLIHHAFSLH